MNILSNIPLPISTSHHLSNFTHYHSGLTNQIGTSHGLKYISLAELLKNVPAEKYPEVFIMNSPEYLPVPGDVVEFSGLKILIITDWNMNTRYLEDLCHLFDFCFTDLRGCRLLRSWGLKNVFHQPLFGHYPSTYYVFPQNTVFKDRKYDFSFVGSFNSDLHYHRNQLVHRLMGLGVRYSVFIGEARGEDYVKILNESKLVWNFAIRGEANMRTYEAMACGAVPLIESTNEEVPFLFKQGIHYLTYSPDSLESDVIRACKKWDLIEAMSHQSRDVVRQYTKAKQFEQLLKFALENRSRLAVTSRKTPTGAGEKSLIKNNILGLGYERSQIFEKLENSFNTLPGLREETVPGILLQTMKDLWDKGDNSEKLQNYYLTHFQMGRSLPNWFRAFLSALYYYWYKDRETCISEAKNCLIELERLREMKGGVENRRSMYDFFIPPLRLGESMNNDINRCWEKDRSSGEYLQIVFLLEDLCLSRIIDCLLEFGRLVEAELYFHRLSGDRYLSVKNKFLLSRIVAVNGDSENTMRCLQSLFQSEPLNFNYWGFVLESCRRMNLSKELEEYHREFSRIASTVYAKNKELNNTLARTNPRKGSELKRV